MNLLLEWVRLLAVAAALLPRIETGRATTFGANDAGNPVADLACYWKTPARRELRKLDDAKDRVVAHRTYPCGSRVWIYNPATGRQTIAVTGDRGPLTADLDLSALVCADLGCTGNDRMIYALVDDASPADPMVRAAPIILARRHRPRAPAPVGPLYCWVGLSQRGLPG